MRPPPDWTHRLKGRQEREPPPMRRGTADIGPVMRLWAEGHDTAAIAGIIGESEARVTRALHQGREQKRRGER